MEARIALFLSLVLCNLVVATVSEPTRTVLSVSNCAELQRALATESDGTVEISVAKNIKCYESDWEEVLNIVSKVEIVGTPVDEGAHFIDFKNANHVLHIGKNASLRLERLIVFQDFVGTVGPLSKTPFLSGEPGARFATAGVLLNYRRCPRLANMVTTPTHARIDRARMAGAVALAGQSQDSPHSFILESVTSEKGMDIYGCQTLVCCGALNRTVSEVVKKIFETNVTELCRFRKGHKNAVPSASGEKSQPIIAHIAPSASSQPLGENLQGFAGSDSRASDTDEVMVKGTSVDVPETGSQGASKTNEMWVWVIIGFVAVLVSFVGIAVIAYRRRQKGAGARLINSAITDSTEAHGSPTMDGNHVTNSGIAEKIPQKMLAKGQPHSYGGSNLSGMLTSWEMPQVGNIRVIRELPMSEVAHSECDNLSTPGGPEATVTLQISGLEVHMRRILGNGSHSSVYEGIYKRMDCALKIIEHSRSMLEMHSETMEDYLTKDLIHPNVVKLLATRTCELDVVERWLHSLQPSTSGASTSCPDPLSLSLFNAALLPRLQRDEDPDATLNTFIVMEYCNGGTLAQALQTGRFINPGRKLNMPLILRRAIDIAHAMEHLHSNCVVHGDLKPENVLLHMTHKDSTGFVCKVVDFSMRRRMPAHALVDNMTLGTMAHMPPELLTNGTVSSATDVYSFGMILWGLVSGRVPFGGIKRSELFRRVVAGDRPPLPSGVPAAYARLFADCWRPEPGRRPDFRMITDRLREMVFQSTGPGESRLGMSVASDGRGNGAVLKGFESSDSGSPYSVHSTDDVFNSYRASTLNSQHQQEVLRGHSRSSDTKEIVSPVPRQCHEKKYCCEGNIPTRESLPGGTSAVKRAVRFARVENDGLDYCPSEVHQQIPHPTGPQNGLLAPRFPMATGGSCSTNWEYDGDYDDSSCPGRTLDSVSTLATLNEQGYMPQGTGKQGQNADSDRAQNQYPGEPYSNIFGTSGGWSVMSSGYSEDVMAFGDAGVEKPVANRRKAEPILESRQLEDGLSAMPTDLSRTVWSNSDVASDDFDRPSADMDRRPQVPQESLRSSDEIVVRLPVTRTDGRR